MTENEKTIGFFRKRLNTAQRNYSTTDKKLLVIIEAIDHFKHHLSFKKLKLRTDHRLLLYLFTAINLTSKLIRWSILLQEY